MGSEHFGQIKLLVVDDEERFREAICRQLKVRGFHVASAGNGEEAIASIQCECPDVVILDQKMPGMDGIEAFQRIKKNQPLTEVIMLTGQATVENAIQVMKMGAFDYIMKPINIDELIYKIEDAYKRKTIQEKKNSL